MKEISMKSNRSMRYCVLLLGAAASLACAQDSGRTVTPGELQWKPGRHPGTEVADIVGDPSKPGPYIQRVRFPPNFKVPPHTHPEERQNIILSGTWYVGWDTKFDPDTATALPAGSFYTEPANSVHFVFSRDEPVIFQISGVGPTATRPSAVGFVPSIADANEALVRAAAACDEYKWREALAWFEVAAEAGDRRAQLVAGLMHLYGDRLYPGIARDTERAKAWLQRAEARGSEEAAYMLARIKRAAALATPPAVATVPRAPPAN
jgi:quercetin dioxygenase-like cupin family protein